jgi:hypothetical protein
MASKHKLAPKSRQNLKDKEELQKFLAIVAVATVALIVLVYILIK